MSLRNEREAHAMLDTPRRADPQPDDARSAGVGVYVVVIGFLLYLIVQFWVLR